MNINNSSAKHKCTSCQMCAAVCPHKAISISLNDDGFYRPYINESLCIDCGICTKVCYKFDDKISISPISKYDSIKVYSAQSLSNSLLKKVTSGGVADILAKELIKKGYTCIGVTYNDDNHRAEHIIAKKNNETDVFRGSKYIQSYSVDAFKYLLDNIKNEKFAIFGLPCHIYAANKLLSLKKKRENCVLIDLFCHGCPSMHLWKKYEQQIKKQVNNKKFDEVQFRSKVRGWGKFHIAVIVDGVMKFISNPNNDEFYSLFFSDHVLNDSCTDCKLRSTMEYTDIRLGDFWGKRYLYDKKGVSAVAINSERGKQLFHSISEQFKIEERTFKEILLKQSYGKVYSINHELRNKMLEALRSDNTPLNEIDKLFTSKQGISYKVKRLIKEINWYIPFDIVRLLKKFS